MNLQSKLLPPGTEISSRHIDSNHELVDEDRHFQTKRAGAIFVVVPENMQEQGNKVELLSTSQVKSTTKEITYYSHYADSVDSVINYSKFNEILFQLNGLQKNLRLEATYIVYRFSMLVTGAVEVTGFKTNIECYRNFCKTLSGTRRALNILHCNQNMIRCDRENF